MKFLIDEQLPPALAGWLLSKSHDAVHVRDIGMKTSADMTIWRFAEQNGAVVVTKDEDFTGFRSRSSSGPQILWLRMGNTTNRRLFERLDVIWPDIVAALTSGAPIVEAR